MRGKLFEIMNKFMRSWDTKINIQKKSIVISYTSNEQSGNKVQETIPFITAPQIIEYLRVNLIKEM